MPGLCLLFLLLFSSVCCWADTHSALHNQSTVGKVPLGSFPLGTVKVHEFVSVALTENKIGLSPTRHIEVYLPAGYEAQPDPINSDGVNPDGVNSDGGNTDRTHRYPVIYYIPFSRQDLAQSELKALLDQAIGEGRLPPVIVVTGDFSTPNGINFFGNNAVTGRWLDFINDELVTLVDNHYATLKSAGSRAISGHFLGAWAAFRLAMSYPQRYGSVYGLHLVGTSTGENSMLWVPNWQEIHSARSFDDLKAPYSNPFVAMAQAYLPNLQRPPFYADFIVEPLNGEMQAQPHNMRKLQRHFHLDLLVPDYADNLAKLSAIGFDWGRNDSNQAHVYGARKLVVVMEDYGLHPQAIEHAGNGWDQDFSRQGYFSQYLIPFFAGHLRVE